MTTLSSIKKEMANQNPGILRKDINLCVSIIFSEIIEALCGNEFTAVELRGYGRFSTKSLQRRGQTYHEHSRSGNRNSQQ